MTSEKKPYSFFHITSLYSSILDSYYGSQVNHEEEDYAETHHKIMHSFYALNDFYERSLSKLFNVDSTIIIINDDNLQAKWAKENNSNAKGNDLVLDQINFYKPTVIMIDDLNWADEFFLDKIRKMTFVKVVFAHHCSPATPLIISRMHLMDFMISCSPVLVKEYVNQGIKNSFLIYHAFSDKVYEQLSPVNKYNDLVFVGSLLSGTEFHNYRRDLIIALLDNSINCKIYSAAPKFTTKQRLVYYAFYFAELVFGNFFLVSFFRNSRLLYFYDEQVFWNKIAPVINKPIFGIDMYNCIQNSKMCINVHGGIAGNAAANMRLFEVTGVGTCLITDDKENMTELFIPDKECITYKDTSEAITKIKYLLKNPDMVNEIANNGRKKCLEYHNYDVRAMQLHEIIQLFLN
jgi:spore maturation protein CgeB